MATKPVKSGKAPAGRKAAEKPRKGSAQAAESIKRGAKSPPKAVRKTAPAKPIPSSAKLKEADENYQLACKNAVQYLHTRRQAMYALARRYHLDADDLQQEGFEVLLTCLRDFDPVHKKSDGSKGTVQFNTFFGVRLEGKALEMRNRDPEYQARQAHLADLPEDERSRFREAPPLLVQHLDQETTMQDTLRAEVSSARRRDTSNPTAKMLAEGFVEKKLNELIAQERDDKRRAALMQVKVGGVASFEEIAYHFGVTDSRASQILNELMDAFYIQRLMAGDLRSVLYDFQKLKFQQKRTLRLLADAIQHTTPERANEIREIFKTFCPEVKNLALPTSTPSMPGAAVRALPTLQTPFKDPFTEEENARYPLRGLEWWKTAELSLLPVDFRGGPDANEPPHIQALMAQNPDAWPLIITTRGEVIDGARRLAAARLRGTGKLLCLVRDKIDTPTAMQLRVTLNLRQIRPDKMDLYWAICALADQGLSQQKIASAIGTSRTNVIVYAKVKEKATPKLRALFEDGFIQITNASASVDLPEKQQDALAEFIRTHGGNWGKGPQFNEAYEAAAAGKLASLAARQSQPQGSPHQKQLAVLQDNPAPAPDAAGTPVNAALRNRLVSMEQALHDAEVWGSQREATIARQTQEIVDLGARIEALERELATQDLMKTADATTREKFIKEIKDFYAIVERLATAAYHVQKAARMLRGQPLGHRQALEIHQQVEALEKNLNALRVETLNMRDKDEK